MLFFKQFKNQQGAALLMVLVAVSLFGLMAGIAGSSWKTIVQRSREADLLFKGNQIREAIGTYYTVFSDAGNPRKQYPVQLEDLLRDPRSLSAVRHLRKLYPDPLTGGAWQLVMAPGGGIKGVYSGSELSPFKRGGFEDVNKTFTDKSSYREWLFVYEPLQKNSPQPTPQLQATGAAPSSE